MTSCRILQNLENLVGGYTTYFGVMDLCKSHARTNSSQLYVLSLYLTHLSRALMNTIKWLTTNDDYSRHQNSVACYQLGAIRFKDRFCANRKGGTAWAIVDHIDREDNLSATFSSQHQSAEA